MKSTRRPDVLECLPHRTPMVMLEHIASVDHQRKRLRATRRFRAEEAFFRGHFPSLPIVPGIYLVEGMAQAGLALFQLTVRKLTKSEIPVLTHVDVRFFRAVFPDQTAVFEARFERTTQGGAVFTTTVKTRGAVAAKAEMVFLARPVRAVAGKQDSR